MKTNKLVAYSSKDSSYRISGISYLINATYEPICSYAAFCCWCEILIKRANKYLVTIFIVLVLQFQNLFVSLQRHSSEKDCEIDSPYESSDVWRFCFQTMYRGINIADAPPRREWMTVDECFDDVIESVEKNIL